MLSDFDPYSLLGVANTATAEEIKNAYRRIARRLHPDSNPNNVGAQKQFQDVTVAYEMLSDSMRRRSYDEQTRQLQKEQPYQFTLNVTTSKRILPILNETQVVFFLADIYPDPRAVQNKQEHETRLNLTLVLDRSNSMNGARMEKVKVAAHQIIDSMNPNDILSIVSFNDRAEVVIPATLVKDKLALKARVTMMAASGGTEIFRGLSAGLEETRKFAGPKLVNHIILLTDGRTYGDQEKCIELAGQAAKEGIAISAMGLGNDWNDEFLDALASKTGGSSAYISSAGAVVKFLNDHVRSLVNGFAERVKLTVAPDPDVQVEMVFKLAPHPQPAVIEEGEVPLGSLQLNRPISVLFQIQLPAEMQPGFRNVMRLVASGDILENKHQRFQAISDLSLEVRNPAEGELDETPNAIIDALSKLSLYRLQERAQEALERGDVIEATRRLEHLATRLIALGHNELANETLAEARRVAHTSGISDKGRKTLKYQTRYLMLEAPVAGNDNQTQIIK